MSEGTMKVKFLRGTRAKVVTKDGVETRTFAAGKTAEIIEKDAVYLTRIGRCEPVVGKAKSDKEDTKTEEGSED
mgnify:CR=1 FL=1